MGFVTTYPCNNSTRSRLVTHHSCCWGPLRKQRTYTHCNGCRGRFW